MDGREYLKSFGDGILDVMASVHNGEEVCVKKAHEIAKLWSDYNTIHEGLEYYGSHFGIIDKRNNG